MKRKSFKDFLFENSLSIVLIVITLFVLIGHSVTGYMDFNEELSEENQPQIEYTEYLTSGSFIESVFENWESEFLQMGIYIILTAFLMQKGSSESKDLTKKERTDEVKHRKSPDIPYPVKRGGWLLKLYENSLSIAFVILFLISFFLHAKGGADEQNRQNTVKGKPERVTSIEYIGTSKFWYESFQNWQSEFLSVFAIVILSIYLRQKGSPESKPVDAPHSKTGS
jgi:hypothetical protein